MFQEVTLDITTFRGCTTMAEHYYASVSAEGKADSYLRYVPTYAEARRLAVKDDYRGDESRIELATLDFVENGTTRFFSVERILREAVKQYPQSRFFCLLRGSHDAFVELFHRTPITDLQDLIIL